MKTQGYFRLYSLILLMLITLSAGLFVYNGYLRENLSSQMHGTLDEIVLQQMFNFDSRLNSDKKIIQGFAELLSRIPFDEKTVFDIMKQLVKNTNFEHLAYATPDGRAYNDLGLIWEVRDRDYFRRSMKGETVISEPIQSRVRDALVIAASTPIRVNGEIVAVLVGSYESSELSKLFLPSFQNDGYACITDNNGEIIAKSLNAYSLIDNGTNLFEFWKDVTFHKDGDHDGLEAIRKNVVMNKGGHSRYEFNGEVRYMHYVTIGTNSWNIFSIVPEQAIAGTANKILWASAILTFVVALVFTIYTIYNYVEQKNHVKELSQMAYFDDLTGAPNFNKFKISAMELIKQNHDRDYVMAKFDINGLKLINEIYGRDIGDEIIKIVASSLDEVIDPSIDAYCRLSADQFVLLVAIDRENESHVTKRKRFEELVKNRFSALIPERLILPEGRYFLNREEASFEEIFENVNFAHRLAKGRGEILAYYDGEIKAFAIKGKEIENRMRQALAEHEFKLFLQPKYRLTDEKIVGAEALTRWKFEGTDFSFPNIFVPVFEKNGFVTKLDMYIFDSVCQFLKHLIDEGMSPIAISVNFSRLHLKNSNFVSALCNVADKWSVPRNYLEVELTESAILDNEELLIEVLEKLHAEGFSLSMDDFGTGYSSLGLLKNIPIDTIKIDRSFFSTAKDKRRANAVLSNIIRMAKDLNIKTVAEGVEEKKHIDSLREIGCDMVQGYYYAKPMPTEEFRGCL